MWLLIAVTATLVLPPIFLLVQTAFEVRRTGAEPVIGFANFAAIFDISGWELWRVTVLYAAGSSAVAIVLGVAAAWLVARTDAPFRQAAFIGAFLSMAAPVIIKAIGWILLLGPNNGLINVWLRGAFGLEDTPIQLYTLGGMILVEGLIWTPIVFLLTLPPLAAMDPSLDDAAAMSGARFWQRIRLITLPLARPSMLAVLLLTFIRSLESFEVPLLIGIPGNLHTFTTVIYETIHRGVLPRYGEASAYAVLLIVIVALPLVLYYRFTRTGEKFATVTGKGFRPSRIELGRWRWPCGIFLLTIPLALAAPLLILLWASFLPFYTLPSLADFARMSLGNYGEILNRSDILGGLWNSIWVATFSSTAVAALAFVLAWNVVRRRERERWALDFIGSLPLILPSIVLGIAILIEFLYMPFIPIYGTIWILVFAFLVKYLPYGMRFCHAGILAVHRELEECARTSGARTLKVLTAIVLPLALPAVVGIWLYVFLHTVRDLSLAILLTGPENQVVSIVILELWENGEVPQLGALSVVLAVIVTVFGLLFMRFSQRGGADTSS
jgi:iron(III) transport system permease protein